MKAAGNRQKVLLLCNKRPLNRKKPVTTSCSNWHVPLGGRFYRRLPRTGFTPEA